MRTKHFTGWPATLNTGAVAVALGLLSGPAFAVDYYLVAKPFDKTIDGTPIPMWGFALDPDGFGSGVAEGPATSPGPVIEVAPGDAQLRIFLRNDLDVPVSLIIPGQHSDQEGAPARDGNGRITALATETAANGGTQTYVWNPIRPGTYLYHSGSHMQVQVQMGLYGAVKKDFAGGEVAYDGLDSYDEDAILLYSEIDPVLHAAVDNGSYGTPPAPTSTIDYNPRYFLINGEPYPAAEPILGGPGGSIAVSDTVLVRFLNAGLRELTPTLINQRMHVVAEDGNPYPYPLDQYAMLLAPGKTKDAIVKPTSTGNIPVVERRLSLTTDGMADGGMLAFLAVGGTGVVANPDGYATNEGTTLNVAAAGLLANDVAATAVHEVNGDPLAGAVALASGATLTVNADGSFAYAPAANFVGSDVFTYRASGAGAVSNVAAVSIAVNQVNDAPMIEAIPDATIDAGQPFAYQVVASDPDPGDTLTYSLSGAPAGMTISASGLISYAAPVAGNSNITVTVTDPGTLSANDSFMLTVNAVNHPPVANNDTASAKVKTVTFINVLGNDTDPDGNLQPVAPGAFDPAKIVITRAPNKNGTASVVLNAGNLYVIQYTGQRRTTETFNYKVKDAGVPGLYSNEATVSVNVTK